MAHDTVTSHCDVVAELLVGHKVELACDNLCGVDANGLLQQQAALVPVCARVGGTRGQWH